MQTQFRVAVLAAAMSSLCALAQDASDFEAPQRVDPRQQVTMADVPSNAFTNRAGTVMIHPIAESALSVTDHLELKTSLLGLIAGPNVAAEYALVQGPDFAVSLEPHASAEWTFLSFGGGMNARLTTRAGIGFFTLSAGGRYRRELQRTITDPTTGAETILPAAHVFGAPLRLQYDLPTSPYTTWSFYGQSDVYSLVTAPVKTGAVGFSWYHAFGGFQLGLGLFIPIGVMPPDLSSALSRVGVNVPFAFLPLPDVTLGWKF